MSFFVSRRVLVFGFSLILVTGVGVFVWTAPHARDAEKIVENVRDFKDLEERFQKLSNERGALYAFEVLRRAPLAPGTDLHLLGHIVGDELYTQKGVAGIADCTQEFRNACSHSIVIGALQEFGEAALGMIRDSCRKAPGGSGAYTMCYHGLGHGVFAYFNYSLPETIDFCRKTGTEEFAYKEFHECVGGVIMELMGGGGHNVSAWEAARTKYLSLKDPLSPCSTALIPQETKRFCYMYITPHLFELEGGSLATPGVKEFTNAFTACDRIAQKETDARHACFGGIGKEFPVLAVDRDIRGINSAGELPLMKMDEWCTLAPHKEAYTICRESIQDSLFWGGENDFSVSIRFCSILAPQSQGECYQYLTVLANQYVRDVSSRESLCALTPPEHSEACRKEIL